MKKTITAIFLVFLISIAIVMPVQADGFSADYARERTAVLAEYVELPGISGPVGYGTCFFVGKDGEDPTYLVTNHHVIEDYLNYGKGAWVTIEDGHGNQLDCRVTMRVYYSSSEFEEAYVVAYDDTKDIAILKLENPTSKRKAFLLHSPESDMQGQSVYPVGYPGSADNSVVEPNSSWSMSDVSITNGIISKFITQRGTGVRMIQTNAEIQPGNSGGPLVDENNSVVGINTLVYFGDVANVYYAVNIGEVEDILNRNNISYDSYSASDDPDPGPVHPDDPIPDPIPDDPTTPTWFFVAGGIVLAAAVGIVGFLASRKEKSSDPQQAAAGQAPAGQAPAGGGYAGNAGQDGYAAPSWQASGQRGNPTVASASSGIPSVRSMSVQHRGERVSLRDRQIVIGRNPDVCSIVFKDGTPGVSGKHCSLSYDKSSGDFLLTDLKSTYGTYLANGQRLEAGVTYRLRSGDSFYLGEIGNTLQVEKV
ncbi:MAG: trypsin-like peptidase domain-containing protein [Lachnospiraceae bacterium]|nr:trypsin-like peptidase domain-containing protein [Lachnospiraceae bacterium]